MSGWIYGEAAGKWQFAWISTIFSLSCGSIPQSSRIFSIGPSIRHFSIRGEIGGGQVLSEGTCRPLFPLRNAIFQLFSSKTPKLLLSTFCLIPRCVYRYFHYSQATSGVSWPHQPSFGPAPLRVSWRFSADFSQREAGRDGAL